MIETHPDPDQALSDPKQQIALKHFDEFITALETKQPHFVDQITQDKLIQLRTLIDELDRCLLETLKHRLEIVEQIGDYKAEHKVTVFQLERWRTIIQDRLEYARKAGMDDELVRSVWNEIHKASIRLQTDVVNRKLKP